MIRLFAPAVLALALALAAASQAKPAKAAPTVCASCIEAHVRHLAAPALNGRRCASDDEARAADYLIGELKRLGVKGGLAGGGYLQTVPLRVQQPDGPARLTVAGRTLVQGQDFELPFGLKSASGPLVRVTDAGAASGLTGAVVFYEPPLTISDTPRSILRSGAVAVVRVWQGGGDTPLSALRTSDAVRWMEGDAPRARPGAAQIYITPQTAAVFRAAAAGAVVDLQGRFAEPSRGATHNVVAVLHGFDPDADRKAVLLSAHYDHLGRQLGKLYPGANDDASGTAAVLEFARVLKAGARPRRTVYFALFGCEEAGGFGATFFDRNPPLPIADLAANIEFEMIGFRDPKHPDKLMLTGYERSNLGPTLAAHGAEIEQDPYPEGNFFQRSDNYALARVGVVAHTISAWPTPPTYHQPTDTADSVDYAFMAQTVASLMAPIRWLVDGDFVPAWNPGGKP